LSVFGRLTASILLEDSTICGSGRNDRIFPESGAIQQPDRAFDGGMPDLALSPFLGSRDVNRFFVDIHPHEHAPLRQGLPPLYVALRVTLIGAA